VVSAPVLKEFTFFDREQKSQNVPGPHMTEALIAIMRAAKGPTFEEQTATVLIGHSFGGAVLETALSETLVGMAAQAKASNSPMRWPANLIMFVNEAQQAIRSYQLIESLARALPARDSNIPDTRLPRPNVCVPAADSSQTQAQQDYAPDPPAIVSISSTGDYATRAAFKGAQAIQRPFNSLRSYTDDDPNLLGFKRQTPMFLNTTAHLSAFESHLMGRCTCKVDSGFNACDEANLVCEDPALDAARKVCKVNIQTRLAASDYLIVEKPKALNRTPYWVLHMPPSIVPDHSTIFTPVFRNLIVTLLNRTTLEPPAIP
jgi:hypothetical protein